MIVQRRRHRKKQAELDLTWTLSDTWDSRPIGYDSFEDWTICCGLMAGRR